MSGSEEGSCVCPQIWGTGLSGGARAVVMLNRHFDEDPMFDNSSITLHWHHLGWEPDMPVRHTSPQALLIQCTAAFDASQAFIKRSSCSDSTILQ